MVTDTFKARPSLVSDASGINQQGTNPSFNIYNVRIIKNRSFAAEKLTNLFLVSERIIFIFLLLFIYLFVALEEIDHQFVLASNKYQRSEEDFDKWSIWNLLNK